MNSTDPQIPNAPRLKGLAGVFNRTRWPGLALACVVVGIYATTLSHSFFVDDFRNLRLMEEYEQGQRPRLRLYEFVLGGDDTRAQRAAGHLPWWAADDLRFTYFRPLSEAVLYGEYRLFGGHPLGYRIVSLTLYLLGVWLALSLYRVWTGDETLARWAAVLFAVASSNAVPVVFIAAQCDVLALVLCLAAMRAGWRFIERGGAIWGLLSIGIYAASLVAKEVAVAAAILPLGMGLMLGLREARLKRAAGLTAVLLPMSLALIGYYAVRHYGSNALPLLNPLSEPVNYLLHMPGRVIELLASWLIHISPFLTYVRGWSWPLTIAYFIVGGGVLMYAMRAVWRTHRRDRRLWAAMLWTAVFLPLLACTNPDNRILMLPMVGLSLCGAFWLTGRSDSSATLTAFKRLPAALLLIVPLPIGSITSTGMKLLEQNAASNYLAARKAFEHPAAQDFVFFLNTPYQFDLLWCQDRALYLFDGGGPRVGYLSHVPEVTPKVLGPRMLRLRAGSTKLFDPFLGRTAMTQSQLVEGARFEAGEFTATIREVHGGLANVVDLEFKQPLTSPHYAFFQLDPRDPPRRWQPTSH